MVEKNYEIVTEKLDMLAKALNVPPDELWRKLCNGLRFRWLGGMLVVAILALFVGGLELAGFRISKFVAYLLSGVVVFLVFRAITLINTIYLFLAPESEALALVNELCIKLLE